MQPTNEREDYVSADAEGHSSPDRSTTTTEFPGKSADKVHLRIACAFYVHAIEQKLKQISETLQKAGASDVSIAVSVSVEGFGQTVTGRSSASWMAPSRGADD
jgi:hypothetical protein